ncbi:MAG: CotH kinase family protein [Bacteroidota bacterium]
MLLISWGCKPIPEELPPLEEVETVVPVGSERYLTGSSDYLFDQESLHTFELTLSAAALGRLDADPAAEEYVEGSLSFEGETISPVGIRYKGSVGAFVNCVSGNDWANPSGRKTCTKLSMKIKINWGDSDRKFYGVKKLQFHSQNLDPSHMHERLAYWLFREMGVPGPRSVHARLIINGEYVGLFALTEQIDGRFARYNFEDGSGNVYKEVWPLTSNGQAQASNAFLSALKTNEDENPSVELMRSFAKEIAKADESEAQAVVSKWMNVDEIISYAVVDRAIRADDGPFHWYCGGGNSCSNHNYYWYEDPSELQMHLIPWDMDNAFENIASNANPVTPIADEWGETSANCNSFPYGAFGLRQRSAACDKLIAAWAMFETEYDQKLLDFKAGPFTESQVNSLLDRWANQIRDAIAEADQLHGDAISVAKWESELNDLKADLAVARNK